MIISQISHPPISLCHNLFFSPSPASLRPQGDLLARTAVNCAQLPSRPCPAILAKLLWLSPAMFSLRLDRMTANHPRQQISQSISRLLHFHCFEGKLLGDGLPVFQ